MDAVAPSGMAMGQPNSFIVPACMNMNAATMRSTLSSWGAQADQRRPIVGAAHHVSCSALSIWVRPFDKQERNRDMHAKGA